MASPFKEQDSAALWIPALSKLKRIEERSNASG